MHNIGIIYIYICGNIHYEGVGDLLLEEMLSESSQLRPRQLWRSRVLCSEVGVMTRRCPLRSLDPWIQDLGLKV